ncbi:POM121-like protein 12 [Fukomys damarensis]|uniref:POM121-like protein 12 n=1 Tax=Fukomys damarensis TaxID=885580 RepID=A0A091DTH9_FUKDA|nr:POM121-like protein 12 [Fukomys damarensis]XP_010621101.1 POM121-like protein 12 [Fukomys damarensis]XP_033617827.1 POM121-like protein 12 [Fukomys damarensis]KFO33758.1 POM121-like protein 12 [Fukomys damarensis]
MGLYLSRNLRGNLGEPKAQQGGHQRPTPELPDLHPVQAGWDDAGAQRALAALARSPAPGRLPSGLLLRPELSYAGLNDKKRRLWAARDPGLQNLVRVQVKAPVGPGTLYQCPPSEERPDPCSKETVLQALAQCTKGKRKFDGPLWFEVPEPKTRRPDPESRPSAFWPMTTNEVTRSFVPRPGPLSRTCAEGNPALGGGI